MNVWQDQVKRLIKYVEIHPFSRGETDAELNKRKCLESVNFHKRCLTGTVEIDTGLAYSTCYKYLLQLAEEGSIARIKTQEWISLDATLDAIF